MAKPRDKVYSATRSLDLVRFMAADEHIGMAMLLSAIQEQMNEVRLKMEREGAHPNPAEGPQLTLIFEAKGGPHHERQGE